MANALGHLVYLVDQSMNLPEPQCSPPLLPLAYNCESLMGWYVRVVSTLEEFDKYQFPSAFLMTPFIGGFVHPQSPIV